MKRLLCLLIVSALLCTTVVISCAEWNNPFKDVDESCWYFNAVNKAVESGIFSGISEDRFDPDAIMTRAMFVTVLGRAHNAELSRWVETPFWDVAEGTWYGPYVDWAYTRGITSGVAEFHFGVNEPVTREQMVTLLYRSAKTHGYDVSINEYKKYESIYDIGEVSFWARDALCWAVQNGIISGKDVIETKLVFAPKENASRAQVAQLFNEYLEYLESPANIVKT